MSLEIEELKSLIVRRFKRRLTKLGVVRIELIADESQVPVYHQTPLLEKLKNGLSASVLVRVFEIALLLSVAPTILPNFKLNYEQPVNATIACFHSLKSNLKPSESIADPFAPLSPVTAEMAVDTHPPPKPIPPEKPDFELDLRRPCRYRTRGDS